MPKIIENYQIQTQLPIFSNKNGLKYYRAKQIGTNNYFILKRLSANFEKNSSQNQNKQSSNDSRQFFQKLMHQTKILKKLEHQRIPKCIRILKTTNSIYLIYENYPLVTLEQYLQKSNLKFTTKWQLSKQIVQTIIYIHSQKIVYNGAQIKNITIDKDGMPYFTDFSSSFVLQKNIEELANQNRSTQEQDIESSYKNDIRKIACIIYQIFNFNNFNSKICVFTNNIQKVLYQILTQIIQQKFDNKTLNSLYKILSQKPSFQSTQSTQSPQSPFIPFSRKQSHQITQSYSKIKFRTCQYKVNTQKSKKAVQTPTRLKSSLSCSKQFSSKQSNSTLQILSSSINILKNSKDQLLSSNGIKRKLTEIQTHIQTQNLQTKIKPLIKYRKICNFILYLIKFVGKYHNYILLILLIIKIKEISLKIHEQLKKYTDFSSQKLKKYVQIIRDENKKLQKSVQTIRNSIQQLAKHDEGLSAFLKQIQTLQRSKLFEPIDQKISQQILQFLLQLFKSNANLVAKKENLTSLKDIEMKDSIRSPLKRKDSKTQAYIYQPRSKQSKQYQKDYQQIKLSYYLSIKLKYGTYQKFIEKKIADNIQNVNILRDKYFQIFQNQQIPVQNLIQQISSRLNRHQKKLSTLNNNKT